MNILRRLPLLLLFVPCLLAQIYPPSGAGGGGSGISACAATPPAAGVGYCTGTDNYLRYCTTTPTACTTSGQWVVVGLPANCTISGGLLSCTGPLIISGIAAPLTPGLALARPTCVSNGYYIATDTGNITACYNPGSGFAWTSTLNPTGSYLLIFNSTVGAPQFYNSTGALLSFLASQSNATMLANTSGGSAIPSAVAIPVSSVPLASDANGNLEPGFPNGALGGSIVAYGASNNNGGANGGVFGPFQKGTGASTTCATGTTTPWPVSGWFRHVSVGNSVAIGGEVLRVGADVDCIYTPTAPTVGPGGVTLGPSVGIATTAVDASGFAWHENAGAQWGFGSTYQFGGAHPNYYGISSEFVADSGLMTTVLGTTALAFTEVASTPEFCGFGGGCSATELVVATPVPFAGTVSNFWLSATAAATSGQTYTVNNRSTPLGSIAVTTVSTDATPRAYADKTHTGTVAAGDWLDVEAPGVAGGTQEILQSILVGLTPTTGAPFMIYGGIETTVTTTAAYYSPFGLTTSGTENAVGLVMPRACTAGNLYVGLSASQGGAVTTTFTVMKNGSATLLTGSIAPSTGAAILALDTSDTVAFAAGDRMTLKALSSGGTSAVIGHWAISCQ